MVSDSVLIDRLRQFLSTSDLDTTTTGIVRKRLEEDFGINLSKRKAFIREQVDLYVQSQFDNAEEENKEENEDSGNVKSEEEEEEEESSSKKGSKKKEVKKRGGGGGFTKVCSLSPQLQKFTGAPELARTEVVKQMWSYIREHDLQDPSNRRNILCDDKLKELFCVDRIDMFQMNKALAKHIWPLDSDGAAPSKSNPKVKPQKHDREDDAEDSKKKGKRQKGSTGGGGGGGFLKPVKISDGLIKFLGTEETELPRSDVIKRIWDYIKLNNLQDPSDKRKIICDEKLKELFDVDTFTGFTVSKLLTAHFIKAETS